MVFCSACGAEIHETAPTCPKCGAPQRTVATPSDRGFVGSIKTCFGKYATFTGRAPRSEYWLWLLFACLTGFVAGIVGGILDIAGNTKVFSGLISLVLGLGFLIPNLSVAVRRLHDLNRSGWWLAAPYGLMFLTAIVAIPAITALGADASSSSDDTTSGGSFLLIPAGILGLATCVMGIVLLVWFCTRGTRGQNRFGADPLADMP